MGSWPAIWMLGENGVDWPIHGEIDIVEVVNGDPTVVMSLHSTNHYGADPQHPPINPYHLDADFTRYPLIAGFEWNVKEPMGEISLLWWFTYYDYGSWKTVHTIKVLQKKWESHDYYDFFDSFTGDGFSLLINLAEGGAMPQTNEVFVDGQPQFMNISSVKVYGFE